MFDSLMNYALKLAIQARARERHSSLGQSLDCTGNPLVVRTGGK